MAQSQYERFKSAYIEAIYFTETGDDEQPESTIRLSPDAFAIRRRAIAKANEESTP